MTENASPTPPLEQGSVFCHNPESYMDDHDYYAVRLSSNRYAGKNENNDDL